jgi:putative transposase
MKAIPKATNTGLHSISVVCKLFSISRDGWYKYQKRQVQTKAKESIVLELVRQERKQQSRVGTRKLHVGLKPKFAESHLKIGRDRLFDILRNNNMLVHRKKASCKTTNSYHHFHKYSNLVKDMKVTRPNQVWVSDITYIRTLKGFCYLALVTDMYSRKIVGYYLIINRYHNYYYR